MVKYDTKHEPRSGFNFLLGFLKPLSWRRFNFLVIRT